MAGGGPAGRMPAASGSAPAMPARRPAARRPARPAWPACPNNFRPAFRAGLPRGLPASTPSRNPEQPDLKRQDSMLKIRLARGGAKKRPYYSIVVADSHSPRDGRFIEKVGTYNPLLKRDDPKRITLKSERIAAVARQGRAADRPRGAVPLHRGPRQVGAGNNPKKGQPQEGAGARGGEARRRRGEGQGRRRSCRRSSAGPRRAGSVCRAAFRRVGF